MRSPSFSRLIERAGLLALALMLLGTGPALARTGDSGPDPGPYAVGCTNIEVDQSLMAPGRSLGDYLSGLEQDGQTYYLDQILAQPAAVFSLEPAVPDDQDLYGQSAGQTLPLVGFICYPTPEDNPRADYQFPDTSRAIPHMQQAGEEPLWADSQAKYPLLVYSHGHSSHPMSDPQILALTRLASQGYVVLALFHGDDRFPDDSPLTGYNQLPLRPLGLKAALDKLETDPQFGSHLDWERVGAIGVSYGGATVLAASGARFTDLGGWGLVDPVHDQRIRAAAGVVSFCGLGVVPLFGLDYSGAGYLEAPQIIVCGDLDPVAPCGLSRSTLQASSQRGYLITVSGQSHLMDTEALYDANYWSLLFLDAYVKEDDQARQALEDLHYVPGGPSDRKEVFN